MRPVRFFNRTDKIENTVGNKLNTIPETYMFLLEQQHSQGRNMFLTKLLTCVILLQVTCVVLHITGVATPYWRGKPHKCANVNFCITIFVQCYHIISVSAQMDASHSDEDTIMTFCVLLL